MSEWKKVKIGDILKRSKIAIDIEDSEIYSRVTIRGKHKGISLRDEEIGKKIGTKKQFVLKAGQFLMSKIDARYGAFGIAGTDVDDAIITGNFWAYDINKELTTVEWINNYTNSPAFYDLCERASSGITHRKYLDEKAFLNHELFIPVIEKQHEILSSLNKRKEYANNITDQIKTQQIYLTKLRQAILQEAIEGKLTADWRVKNPVEKCNPDFDAAALLAKIQAEKKKLIADGKIKKEKPLSPINLDAVPFALPDSWMWCKFGDYATLERGRFSIRPRNDKSCYGGKFPFIQIGALNGNGDVVTNYKQTLNEKGYAASKEFPKGTIAVAVVGGTIGNLGVLGMDMCFPDSIVGIRPFHGINQTYKLLLLKYRQPEIKKAAYQMAGQPNIKIPTLAELVIPLPPLAEQNAIVERVDRLLASVNALEQQVQERKTYAEQLMQAVLKEAFTG